MDFADLHTHSLYSDGTCAPGELVKEARAAGLSAIALTDHDVLEGLAEAREAAAREGLEMVSGVEISTRGPAGEIHVLGYDIDAGEGSPLQPPLARQRVSRQTRMPRILERLERLGLPLTAEEVEAIAGRGSTGRPHVARAMVIRGYVGSVEEAFARFLRQDGPAYVDRDLMDAAEGIALIRAAGGLASVAHPGFIRLGGAADLETLLKPLVDAGLEGLECFTTAHDGATTALCVAIARRLGLTPTGGSDYHGASKQGVRIGRTRGGGRIPYAILADVRERIARRGRGE
jgi:predicted metal-dependent phosphoesterase TrpH